MMRIPVATGRTGIRAREVQTQQGARAAEGWFLKQATCMHPLQLFSISLSGNCDDNCICVFSRALKRDFLPCPSIALPLCDSPGPLGWGE